MTLLPRWPVPRSIWLAVAGSAVVLLVLVAIGHHRNDVDVLTPPVVHAIKAEQADRPSIDSAVAQARYEADMAKAERLAAEAHAQQLQRAAAVQGRRADSLALEARHAATARDSAMLWHVAYAARTGERDSLALVIDTLHLALSFAAAEAHALRVGLDTANRGRLRADSVLDATVAAVVQANCRVPLTFGLVHCMSRTNAALVGIAVGVGGKMTVDAIRDGRLTLPIPFR